MVKKLFFLIYLIFIVSTTHLFSQEVINKGRISGYMFGDYYYNLTRDTGISSIPNAINGGERDLNGFQLRRIYFTYDYDISEKFTTRFRLEADQVANTSNNKIGVFVKDAYLQWKNIFKGSDLLIGIQPTPAYEISEGVWGNRFLEKTIMDARGIVPSRDIALSLKGNLLSDGKLKYWLMIGDGSGNSPEVDKYKRFYAHLQLNPIKDLTATLYADLKSRPNINDPNSTTTPPVTLSNNDLTYALFVGYKKKDDYTFGVESFINQRQNGMITGSDVKDQYAIGLSVFASYNFMKQIALVGRYDYYDPNFDSDVKGDSRNWFIFSLNIKPDDKVTISPNVVIETYESLPSGRSFKSSITPRITFFYSFF